MFAYLYNPHPPNPSIPKLARPSKVFPSDVCGSGAGDEVASVEMLSTVGVPASADCSGEAVGVEVGVELAVVFGEAGGETRGAFVARTVGFAAGSKSFWLGGEVGTGVATYTGALVGWVYPLHITIAEYKQEEFLLPSLHITCPFPCGPAAQLTPPWPEQQPLVAREF